MQTSLARTARLNYVMATHKLAEPCRLVFSLSSCFLQFLHIMSAFRTLVIYHLRKEDALAWSLLLLPPSQHAYLNVKR